MPEANENIPATVPEQPESKPPLRKSMPVVIALVVIIGLIGIANISSLLSGNKKAAQRSALTMSPTTQWVLSRLRQVPWSRSDRDNGAGDKG